MPINPLAQYQQVLSMALEERAPAWQDLVSNGNILLAVLKDKGLWEAYSGPRIRETLQIAKADMQWYGGYDYLDNPPIELFNDAFFTPKMGAVPVSLSMEEILNNQGKNQLKPVLKSYISAAESSLKDGMDLAIHGDGTANGGKQLTGLAAAVPIITNAGTYGGISRVDNAIWRTTTYDIHSAFAGMTQWTSTTVRPILNKIMTARSRGKSYADLLLMSPEVYEAYDAATLAIQKVTNENSRVGKLGFPSLQYVGGGKNAEIVQDGGIGSNMPANTVYGLNTDSLRLRYNPARNFDKLFEGDGQKPINQDALAQFIGWMGELTMTNPLFNWRAYDSNPSA